MKNQLIFGFFALAAVAFVSWAASSYHRSSVEQEAKLTTCEAALTAAKITKAEADVRADAAQAKGRAEGWLDCTSMPEAPRKQPPELVKCDPLTPPYQPCCGEVAELGGVTEEAIPRTEDFKNGRMLPLWCARTAHVADSAHVMSFATGKGPPWVCGRTERKCRESKQKAFGQKCQMCYVYMASGYPSHEDFVWTSHALDEVDGPWNSEGTRGVFP